MGTTYFAGSALSDSAFYFDEIPESDTALTKREKEVLGLIGDGLYNYEITARLGISYHTLHRHVSAILEKLDARNRMEAFTISLRDGLVDCPRLCQYRYGSACTLGGTA